MSCGAFFWTTSRNTYELAVKTAQILHLVHVIMQAQGVQRLPLLLIFLLVFDRLQPQCQPTVADKMLFPFPDNAFQGTLYDSFFQQDSGQKWQVFLHDRPLEGNAGGGDHQRIRIPGKSPGSMLFYQNTRHEVGIGFTDSHPGIAERYFSFQQCGEHFMAETDLFFPDRKPPLWKNGTEDFLHLPVCLFPVLVVMQHPIASFPVCVNTTSMRP